MTRFVLFALLAACSRQEAAPVAPEPAPVAAAEVALPGDSLYLLDVDLVDQHGTTVGFDAHRGNWTIVSMFYASCPMACPMLVEDILALERQLTESERQGLRVLLVSLDPANDTPEAMAAVVARHAVDDARWTLARPEPTDVRLVAAMLGIAYRADGQGGMNHSSILTLVDPLGVPRARLDGLKRDPAPLIEALRKGGS